MARITTTSGRPIQLEPDAKTAGGTGDSIPFPLPAVEVAIPHALPPLGSRTAQLKVLSQTEDARSLTLELEAEAPAELAVRLNRPNLKIEAIGATLGPIRPDGLRTLTVDFPSGSGYQQQTVKLSW